MIAKFFGTFTLLCGIVWMFRPDWLKGWLVMKTGRWVFWFLLGALVFPIIHHFGKLGTGWVLAIVAAFWIGMGMFTAGLRKAFDTMPLVAFRAAGLLNFLGGVALLWPKK